MHAEPLFPTEPAPHRDPVDPRAIECPTCGAAESRPCQLSSGGSFLLKRGIVAHQARRALARHLAGVADEPTPTLLDERS